MSSPYLQEITESTVYRVQKKWLAKPGVIPYTPDYSTETQIITYLDRITSVKSGVKPTTESRVKPFNLIANQTSRGPFHRFESTPWIFQEEQEMKFVNSFPRSFKQDTFYHHVLPTSFPSFADPGGQTKHRLKIRDRVNDVSSLIAESAKTARQLAASVGKVYDIYRDIKRGRWNKLHRKLTVHDVATTHLAVNFGLKPILDDIHTVTQRHQAMMLDCYQRIDSGAKDDVSDTYLGVDWRVKSSNRFITHIKVTERAWTSAFEVGNPIEWAWEAIPFSFVVDWIVPIGDYIGAHARPNGISHHGTSVTTRASGTGKVPTPSGLKVYKTGSVKFDSWHRSHQAELVNPEPPSWDPPKSFTSLGNAIALLVAVRGPKGPRPLYLR